jgi:predicted transcriptional regulator
LIRAKVESDPRTGEIVLIGEEFKEIESRPAPPKLDEGTRQRLREISDMSLKEMRSQIAPDMVGRPLVQESRLLTLLSPLRILDVGGREIPGSLIEVLLGDSTTNKSACAKDTAKTQGFGHFIQAENTTRAGLTYGITERATGGWTLTWGILPRSHGKYIVIDGLEKWNKDAMMELRAVMREQEIRVDRVVHGLRPAALRTTVTLNPRKPMRQYPFPCMAIQDTDAFSKGPDIARVDLWHVFSSDDVVKESIASRVEVKRPVDDELFRTLVYWAWSRKSSDIKWLPDAAGVVKKEAAKFMNTYGCSALPIVHPGFRDVLCRVACAFAVLRFSTTDGEDVVVQKGNVDEAVAWLRGMYDTIQLREYKEYAEEGVILTGGEFLGMIIAIGEDGMSIVQFLIKGSQTSEELAKTLGGVEAGYTPKVIRDRYDLLRDQGLIETRSGKGASLTPKGVEFFHQIRRLKDVFVLKSVQSREVRPKKGPNKSPRTLGDYPRQPVSSDADSESEDQESRILRIKEKVEEGYTLSELLDAFRKEEKLIKRLQLDGRIGENPTNGRLDWRSQ